MVGSNADPARILSHVEDPIRSGSAKIRDHEIMDPNRLWLALGPQLSPYILELTDQLPLLGIDGNDRIVRRKVLLNPLADVLELGITIRVAGAFQRLTIRLKAIVEIMQNLGDHPMAGLMSHLLEFFGQTTNAFASPP
jgi:hypothetical protein